MKLAARLVAVGAVVLFAAGHGLASSQQTQYGKLLSYAVDQQDPSLLHVHVELDSECLVAGTARVLEAEIGVQVKIPATKTAKDCGKGPHAGTGHIDSVEVHLASPLGEREVVDDHGQLVVRGRLIGTAPDLPLPS